MKRKNLKMRIASLVVFLLVGVMGITAAASSFLWKSSTSGTSVSTNSAIQATQSDTSLAADINADYLKSETISKTDRIGMIIEMEETTLIDIYNANPGKYESFTDYRLSAEGKAAAENLINKQNAVYNKIARQADVELLCNYVNAMNAFAIEITYGDWDLIETVATKAKVANVTVSERYYEPEATVVTNTVAAYDTGIFDSTTAIEMGIAGQGTIVAVLDTGLDWEHVAFDPNHELFHLEEQKENGTLKITREFVQELIEEGLLAASNGSSRTDGDELFTPTDHLVVDEVYKNEKVPFTFDYSDMDPETNTHVANSHGTHVAGIIAGHSDTPFIDNNDNGVFDEGIDEYYYDDEDKQITGITGVAPQAQIAAFKVFGDGTGGADSYAIYAAIEDSITLGVDVINMSLGGDCGFQDETESKDSIFSIYQKLEDTGISLVVAAGNSYSSSFSSHAGLNLTSNPDSGLISTPGSYDNAFTVASMEGVKSPYLLAVDGSGDELGAAYFLDSTDMGGDKYDFIGELRAAVESKGLTQYVQEDGSLKIPYVTISGVGNSSNYAGKDVRNKIALVSRGEINFEDKVNEAANNGAVAIVVFNNASGVIRMSVGDNPGIPSCSIMMDAAFAIKGQDANGGAYFIIDEDNEAGPFISEFSSLGPLPNLVLKPDITAHGGEIYSAIPGNETAYDRMSGTSMACPNTAGVVALLRQYMSQPDVAAKFGIDLNGDGKVSGSDELNLMEVRIYQLLQSTATIVKNEDGNPYSPRKQGAGLADLEATLATEQYLYVVDEDGNEGERTKIELFDDPEKTGVYELEFYVKNAGATEQQYNIDAYVMTEGVSADGKTVSERAHILTDNVRVLKVDGEEKSLSDAIVVPANSSVKITYTVTLGNKDREWLTKFENGMYIEGFVCLTNTNKEACNLNIPYLAFYGDWSEAPLFDYDLYETSKDLNDDNIDDDDKRYSNTQPTQLIGKIMENGAEYSIPLGWFPFYVPDEFESLTPDAKEDYCSITYDSDTGACGIFCVGGYLRNAKKVFWVLTDATTGDVIKEGTYYGARKGQGTGSTGGAWIELDLGTDLDLANNRKYNMAVYPVLDWHSEDFTCIQDVIDYNEEYNEAHPEKTRRYCWDSDFWVDTEAPYLSDVQIRIERDKNDNATYSIDFYLTDNHYMSAFGFSAYNPDTYAYESIYSDTGMYPVASERNSTTCVTFDITDMWDQISDGVMYRNTHSDVEVAWHPELSTYLTQFQIRLVDYAFNTSYFVVDVYELMDSLTSVSFGDIGNYTTYTNSADKNDTVKVMTSYNKDISTDKNGNQIAVNSITIVPGQKVELMKAVIAKPSTAWREDFKFSIAGGNTSILKVDDETGEIYALPGLESDGPEYVTVRIESRVNSNVYCDLQVRVLTDSEVAKYKINTSRMQAVSTVNSLTVADVYYKDFSAGEVYYLEIETNPWYVDVNMYDAQSNPDGEYFIKWSTGNANIATVEAVEGYPLYAKVTANDGYYDDNGEYVKNYAAMVIINAVLCQYSEKGNNTDENGRKYRETYYSTQFYANVLQEFVVEGSTLNEYHGTPDNGVVVIPDNLGIKTLAGNLFYERTDITEIHFNEGLETIGYATCAYMPYLQKVVFSSTIHTVSDYAFAASMKINDDGPVTRLTVVDTTACTRPIQAGRLAFAMQRYIGINGAKSYIYDWGDDDNNRNKIVLLKEGDEDYGKFDMSVFRTADEYAFYDCMFLTDVDLSGLRMSSTCSFYGLGRGLYKYFGTFANVKFGEHTAFGDATFATAAIGEVELPMQRIGYQAFFGYTKTLAGETEEDDEVEGVYMGELRKVTFTADDVVIEEGAFLFASVEEVEFKGSVEFIGNAAFAYTKLTSVKFAEGKKVKEIGAQAFYGTPLESIKLPAGLEVLGNGAFGECTKLTKVEIDKDCLLTELGATDISSVATSPFYGCNVLAEFSVDEGNEFFCSENGIIYNADKTAIVNVPVAKKIEDMSAILSGVEELAHFAFAGNASVKSVDLSNIKKMGIGVFSECVNLESVTIPATFTEIPDETFYGCEKLTDVSIESNNSIERIGLYAFFETGITGLSNILYYNNKTLTEVAEGAFAYSKIKTVAVPQKVDTIADDTFYGCEDLEAITFGNTNRKKYIGERAFTQSGLTSISGKYIVSIGSAAFAYCDSLVTVDLPGVETIGDYAFFASAEQGEDGIESEGKIATIDISSVKTIGDYAFSFQTKLASEQGSEDEKGVLVLNSIKSVGDYAFYGCEGLNIVQTGTSVESLGEYTFAESGIFAFYQDINIASYGRANLTENMTTVDPTSFASTDILEYYVSGTSDYFTDETGVLYRNVPAGGYELVAFPSNNWDSMEYTVLDGTVRIGEYAFAYSEYITRVNIPSSVKAIGDCAFYASSVRIFNFNTLVAPELEAGYQKYEGDSDIYFWQIYNNFYMPFTYSNGTYNGYKYNPIRLKNEEDDLITFEDGSTLQNTAYTAAAHTESLSNNWYGIMICRPSNATGFDNFIWSNYFDSEMLLAELIEDTTIEAMEYIRALPAASEITKAHQSQIERARNEYDMLSSDQQRAFVREAGLVTVLEEAEKAYAALSTTAQTECDKVVELIAALPSATEITLDNKAAVVAAREAYNALSASAKTIMDANTIAMDKLTACEARIAQLESGDTDSDKDGESCGTVAFGGGFGGGTGLMIGLITAMLACLAIVFFGKKKAMQK